MAQCFRVFLLLNMEVAGLLGRPLRVTHICQAGCVVQECYTPHPFLSFP